ncbi:MAG: ABC transporter ATP-binding protein [Lachnospiraceae bacterium]|nr:ABC transporter ATP-binding protein [Lachnospiraceae bacterium]
MKYIGKRNRKRDKNMDNIVISNLNFQYEKDSRIFENASMDLKTGNIYLLTGENGSGKTTLMKLIAGLISGADVERIRWKGKDVNSFLELKERIVYVSETPYLYDYLTGRENVDLIIDLFGISDKRENVYANIRDLNLSNDMNKLVKDYSLGMRYKLFLSAALLVDSDLVLMDEPFSSLDSEGQLVAQKMVDLYVKRGGIVIISTHIKGYISKYNKCHYMVGDRGLKYEEH